MLSATGGKEWSTQKENALRTLGLHLRLLSRGGYWYTPINIRESKAAQREVLLWEEPYSQQLPAYYSLDVRVSHTRQKPGYTRIWSLDIQNVTGNENLGWYYYDFFSEEVKAQYQLGLIPVIAYRIQF